MYGCEAGQRQVRGNRLVAGVPGAQGCKAILDLPWTPPWTLRFVLHRVH